MYTLHCITTEDVTSHCPTISDATYDHLTKAIFPFKTMKNLWSDTLIRPYCSAKSHGILVSHVISKSYKKKITYEKSSIRSMFISLYCLSNAQMQKQDVFLAQEYRHFHQRVNTVLVCLLPVPQGRPSETCRQKQTQILSHENRHTWTRASRPPLPTYQWGLWKAGTAD